MRGSRVRGEAWLVGAALLTLAAGLGLRDPWAPDEPRYVLIASEMLHTGDWMITRHGGVVYSQKPPLYFWLLAAAQWLGGMRLGFLLPALGAGLGCLLLTWDLGAAAVGQGSGCVRRLGSTGLRAIHLAGAQRADRRGAEFLGRHPPLAPIACPGRTWSTCSRQRSFRHR